MKSLCLALWLIGALHIGAREIDFDGGNIAFDAPDGFTPLTQDEIARKFPRRTGPLDAVGSDTRDVLICYSVTKTLVQPGQLSDLKNALSSKLTPGTQMIKNEFIEINGTRWIHFEMTTQGTGLSAHDITLITSYNGHMLVFNFTCATAQFEAFQKKLETSLNSVKIKNAAGAPLETAPGSSASPAVPAVPAQAGR